MTLESARLRPLSSSTVHFKVGLFTFAFELLDLLTGTGLGLNSFDVGAGFLQGQGLCSSRFGF